MAALASDIAAAPTPTTTEGHTWSPLRYLNLYRLILIGLFAVLYFTGTGPDILGKEHPRLFALVTLLYLGYVLVSGFAATWRYPRFTLQLRLNTLVDISALILLMYASGGVTSGIGMLVLITIAAASLLMTARAAVFFAAYASITLLATQMLGAVHGGYSDADLTQAGILGATYFATAILGYMLARRVRESEALAQQRGLDLANMEQLNAYLVQHLRSGILVVDPTGNIRLMNEAAWYLLGMPARRRNAPLASHAPELAQRWDAWRSTRSQLANSFEATLGTQPLLVRFTPLAERDDKGTVIFLEDAAALSQQVQQMKLASLGRLTASIAHEVRNPLCAISHAGQLLSESQALQAGDQRLTEIIRNHALRVNTIIENVLQLSRREQYHPEDFVLLPWLEGFLNDFCRDHGADPNQFSLDIQPADTAIRMDPSHLSQVLGNLLENALRYGRRGDEPAQVALVGGITRESRGPFLDVIDQGPGIDAEAQRQIFEPFFTTSNAGTGLGLYIARELCEFNSARLTYLPAPTGGSCFRIAFTDPRPQVL